MQQSTTTNLQFRNTTITNMVWRRLRGRKAKGEKHDSSDSSSTSSRSNRRLKSCMKRDGESSVSDYQSCDSGSSSFSPTLSSRHDTTVGSSRLSDMSTSSRGSCSEVSLGCYGPQEKQTNSTGAHGDTKSRSSATEKSTGSRSSASRPRVVQFNTVEIRDYERILGDNPSCSSGAPIGIGWSYNGTQTLDLIQYEKSRPYRRKQLEMILSRDEREGILSDWGVSSSAIASSVRAMIKAKNQRRQTVRNLNKAQRLEEGIESASRKLKRAFLSQRDSKQRLEQPLVETKVVEESDYIRSEDRQDRKIATEQLSTETITESEDDILKTLKVQTGGTEATTTLPGSSKGNTATSTLSDAMDNLSFTSGFTIGGSTTASALEMEAFYRELELEMFGENELPSMVGQTLEVDVEIAEEDKVYYEPSPICGSQEPPSVAYSTLQQSPMPYEFRGRQGSPHHNHIQVQQHNVFPERYQQHNRSPQTPVSQTCFTDLRGTVGDDAIQRSAPMVGPDTGCVHQRSEMNFHSAQRNQIERQNGYIGSEGYDAHLGSSRAYSVEQTAAAKLHDYYLYKQQQQQNRFLHSSNNLPQPMFELRPQSNDGWTGMAASSGIAYSRSSPRRPRQVAVMGSPRVTHTPLPSHLTPTIWMEGIHRQTVEPLRQYEPVTINEDSVEAW